MRLSFLTLQRGNALGYAPRHRFAPHRTFRIGRGASRTACDAERRTITWGSSGQNSFNGSSFSAAICSRRARIWSPQ
ncbi:hypothetical protein B1F73_28255 [Pseudomonas syringae]|nr:hypothetical protein B1F77_06930 [Pseudomonas syringae]RXT81416.1 hypothetical protein B1F72_27705 [Pseudomonas syringae]RXT91354.1 hypothetical protein B1F73_28255 [Pseudomonas syringae]RXU24221.1 hypothetical protein B0A92_15665 [Pseudomonas syringae]